jgi:hypothetical protein
MYNKTIEKIMSGIWDKNDCLLMYFIENRICYNNLHKKCLNFA